MSTMTDTLHVSTCDVKPINIDWSPDDEYREDGPQFWEPFEYEEGDKLFSLVAQGGSVVAVIHEGAAYARVEHDDYQEAGGQEDGETFAALFEVEPYQWGAEGPMMNYWYPLEESEGPYRSFDPIAAASKLDSLPLCVVEVEGEYGLALTGGGMDLSWEICAAYVTLGKCPPVHFADLPRMAESWSARKELVYQGMRQSLEFMSRRIAHRLERLVELYDGQSVEN